MFLWLSQPGMFPTGGQISFGGSSELPPVCLRTNRCHLRRRSGKRSRKGLQFFSFLMLIGLASSATGQEVRQIQLAGFYMSWPADRPDLPGLKLVGERECWPAREETSLEELWERKEGKKERKERKKEGKKEERKKGRKKERRKKREERRKKKEERRKKKEERRRGEEMVDNPIKPVGVCCCNKTWEQNLLSTSSIEAKKYLQELKPEVCTQLVQGDMLNLNIDFIIMCKRHWQIFGNMNAVGWESKITKLFAKIIRLFPTKCNFFAWDKPNESVIEWQKTIWDITMIAECTYIVWNAWGQCYSQAF